ncbi:ABC transporter permease subunit [Leptospira sp. GIMC2001]|uniref:ABC transporter permease subunit n=1 Tax=Leptospira sp. GIMC2001 TaxID=1513297 RepID=UPI00234B5795|nr:ABC transporter permease subunit [Leptospira sp. GIMC2001]WCL50191.1 ABC transporter permease subunit [Leptospira sp. GIMC2001]
MNSDNTINKQNNILMTQQSSSQFIEFFHATRSELLKLNLLKVPLRIAVINIVVLFCILGIYFQFSSRSDVQVDYSLERHKSIIEILSFFTHFIFLMIISVTICTQFGREFEWRTVHQFFIKGLSRTNLILSKFIAFSIIFILEYLLYSFLILGIFFLFSPASFTETFSSIPWIDQLAPLVGIPLTVAISIFSVTTKFSATSALVQNVLYFILFEGVFRGILSGIQMIEKIEWLDQLREFFPYKSYLSISNESPDNWKFMIAVIAATLVLLGIAVVRMNRKEPALINT